MPPKKTEGAAAAPKPKPTHGSYQDMITDAIINLKDRNGSSRQSLKKYVRANNTINTASDNMFDSLFNKALKAGVEKGIFEQPKGPSGGTKLAKKSKPAAPKKEAKPAAKKAAPKKEAKPAAKKETKEKAAAPKKAASAAPKKAAAPKKEASKKEAKPADKKTKTGRVTKPAAPKKTATKAAPAKKAAAPKKAAPKKAEKAS